MKVTSTKTGQTVTRGFTITEDHPVVPMAYNRQGKQVRVLSGTIEYTQSDSGWIVRTEYAVSLACVVLRKDGTDSLNAHTRNPNEASGSWRRAEFSPAEGWEWVQTIIALLRPAGSLAMMTLAETGVNA